LKKRAVSILLAFILVIAILPSTALAGSLSNFIKVNTYTSGMFSDVPSTQWYADEVQQAYEYGLMNGKSATTFEPDSNLKLSEAIKLAACLHSIYHTGSGSFTSGEPWYRPYVDYALANGIISSEYPNYDAYATRADFAVIFAKALPEEALTAINTIKDGAIPDVQIGYSYGPAVYLLYRAGVLTGSGTTRAYNPNNNIKRSEVSAIAARMANSAFRQTFSLTVAEPTATELTATEVSAKCSSAVFYIEVYNNSGTALGSGSGFFINSSGMAVTNHHVVEGAASARIWMTDGKSYDVAGVYDYSEEYDLALLQINGSNFPYLELADSSTVVTGSTVYAIGSPEGLDNTLSQGIVSNAARKFTSSPVSYIQIDAAISHGSSGGALLNTRGQVIGVTSYGWAEGQNLNLAVPINLLQELSRTNYVQLSTIVSESDYTIIANPSFITLAVGSQVTATITDPSGNPDLTVAWVADDDSIVTCTWGDFVDNYNCPLYIKGLKAGTTVIHVGLLDNNDNILAETWIEVTVTGGSTGTTTTYYSGYYPVPDFGAYTGIPLYFTDYNDIYKSPGYFYKMDDYSGDIVDAISGYIGLLLQNGFTYLDESEDADSYFQIYENTTQKMRVAVGLTNDGVVMIVLLPQK
jgi:S1-C subfamily serine protease